MPKGRKGDGLFYIHPKRPKNAHPAYFYNGRFCDASQGLTEFCQHPETTPLDAVEGFPCISLRCSLFKPNKHRSFCVRQANTNTLFNKASPDRHISPAFQGIKEVKTHNLNSNPLI